MVALQLIAGFVLLIAGPKTVSIRNRGQADVSKTEIRSPENVLIEKDQAINSGNTASDTEASPEKIASSSEAGNLDSQNNEGSKSDEMRFLFFGDLMLDRHVREKIVKHGYDYPFKKLFAKEGGLPQNFNLVGANLEGAVTAGGKHYPPQNSYDFAFLPDSVEILKDYGFNFFNLANNHFSDQGKRGQEETRKELASMGFDFSGCQDAVADKDCSPAIVEIKGRKISMLVLVWFIN